MTADGEEGDGVSPAPPAIETARLRLVAATLETATATATDATTLERLLGVAVPPDWASADVKDVLPGYAESLQADPGSLGWGPWFTIAPAEGVLVGSIGFYGPPSTEGVVEVGYEIFAPYRGRGYATEALRALLGWAFAHGVRRATARCAPDNVASVAVLRKAGLSCVQRADVWHWAMRAEGREEEH